MHDAGFSFEVVTSDAEEATGEDFAPKELAAHNAALKAQAVFQALDDPRGAVVIGSDTIVVLGDTVLGKPADADDARHMLRMLSGKTHQVMTGVCIIEGSQEHRFVEVTDVVFEDLDDARIDAYVATGEPLDKAGAYGIQGKGGALVDHISGDYENVVGLPITRVTEKLASIGIYPDPQQ